MIIKVKPNLSRVKSMLEMVGNRESFISSVDFSEFSNMAIENYYEVIRELGSSLILLEGFKAVGESAHKDLIEFLLKRNFISREEYGFLNRLRMMRNESYYEGKMFDKVYLENHSKDIFETIKKLKKLVMERLK